MFTFVQQYHAYVKTILFKDKPNMMCTWEIFKCAFAKHHSYDMVCESCCLAKIFWVEKQSVTSHL